MMRLMQPMRWRSILALLIVAAACGERTTTGTGPYADKVAEDVPKIEKALGVKFKTPPKLEIRDREQVRQFVLSKLNEPAVIKQTAAEESVYKLLGMIPDTMHLADAFVRVLSEQIMGYYDPKTKVLYVVKDAPEEFVGITIMHELVHALQDQYVNLDSLESIVDDDDRAAAAQAVVEGQAMYEQMYIMSGGGGNIAAQMPGGWESIRASIRETQTTQPVFSSSPMVIQETLLFPYINGGDFVHRFKAHEPGKLPFDKLPVSTKQLMHDDAYFGKAPDVPSEIVLPKIPGTVATNDLGEFSTRLFFYQHTHDRELSGRAAQGWDGDRYALVKTPAGNAFVWASVWDTPNDAAEFMSAIDAAMAARYNVRPLVTGEKRHFETAKRTIDVDVREMGGRPVVLYVDVPAGRSTSIVDFAQVKVTPR
jgi:hypothetical protein